MNRLRTIPGFVRLLAGLFLMAQLAGVVSSPRASAQPAMADAGVIHDMTHDHAGHHQAGAGADQPAPAHHHHDGNLADTCCALHAYFAGVMPPPVAVKTANVVGERLAARRDFQSSGVAPGRLDRPPRPLH
jgi:DUF2946 family protein